MASKTNVLVEPAVQTVEEFDALLEQYKQQNPVKFAQKEANGDFERQRSKLFGSKAKEVKPEKKVEPKKEAQEVEESKEEKVELPKTDKK
jgi:hypothetical protein